MLVTLADPSPQPVYRQHAGYEYGMWTIAIDEKGSKATLREREGLLTCLYLGIRHSIESRPRVRAVVSQLVAGGNDVMYIYLVLSYHV